MERGIKKTDYNRKSCKSITTTYQSLQHEQFIHFKSSQRRGDYKTAQIWWFSWVIQWSRPADNTSNTLWKEPITCCPLVQCNASNLQVAVGLCIICKYRLKWTCQPTQLINKHQLTRAPKRTIHNPKNAFKIWSLIGKQLVKSNLTLWCCCCHDHLPHCFDSLIRCKELHNSRPHQSRSLNIWMNMQAGSQIAQK